MGSFVAASVYLCFTLLYERQMRSVNEGDEEEGKKEASTNENTDDDDDEEEKEEEKGKEIGNKANTSVPEVGGEGYQGN